MSSPVTSQLHGEHAQRTQTKSVTEQAIGVTYMGHALADREWLPCRLQLLAYF